MKKFLSYDTGDCDECENCEDPETDPETLRDTINKVKDPCIKSALNKALNSGITTKVGNLMSSTFVGSSTKHLTFEDYPFSSTKNAVAYTSFGSTTNLTDITISFNTNVMPLKSQEYNVATVYHEVLHAYFNILYGPAVPGNPRLVPSHHEYIATNYINMLKADLKAIYPTMSDDDALYLAWGGLEGTNLFSLQSQTFKTNVNNTNVRYSTKPGPSVAPGDSKGQYCP